MNPLSVAMYAAGKAGAKAKDKRIEELESALHKINALNDTPARFNSEIQDVLNSVIDTSDHKFD
jgi:uncharacterized protein YbaP (TraB family)